MKKLLQKFSTPVEEGFVASFKDKSLKFINEHPELFCLSLLALACLLFLFFGLNFYPLIDVDETRYAVIARDLANSFDWNSLNLNMIPFLEKPPLYFWLVGASIKLFGGISGFAVRLPIAILSTFIVFFTYYVGKIIISRKYGMISALILLSSIFFLILSHIAILDMVLTVFMTSAIYCGLLTHFCQEKNKKYYWWYFYLFVGIGFLAKGILALAIPFTIIFIYNLITKTAKDIFKPVNLLPGLIIFSVIAIPWHLIMYKEYGFEFVKQYFLIHHFGRFMGSEYIGRERPLLYFVPVFLLGFFPWSLIFLTAAYQGIKNLVEKYQDTEGKFKNKIRALFETSTNEQKLLLFASLYFIIVFVLFSISSTKLPTYILPVFPAAALLTGYYWWVSDEKDEHQEEISVITQLFSFLLILAASVAMIAYFFLPVPIQLRIESFKHAIILGFYLFGIFLLLRLNTKRALSVFSGYIFVMLFIVLMSVSKFFNLIYSTGENELVNYSRLAQATNSSLVTFDFAVKPSVLVNYTDKVNFITDPDFDTLNKLLDKNNKPIFVIVKNKNFEDNGCYKKKLDDKLGLIKEGERYSLYFKDSNNKITSIENIVFTNGSRLIYLRELLRHAGKRK